MEAEGTGIRQIAPGVRQVSVGVPTVSYSYLIDGPDGPIAFDAGIKGGGRKVLAAAGGRLDRVILSHSHPDHRGGANELGAPVYCHPDEVADAEGDAGRSYADFGSLADARVGKFLLRLAETWDGGPVEIAGTIGEDEHLAGFRVIHTPGHAPGQIALFRESDRLLLAADAVFTVDTETGAPIDPSVPKPFSNWDTEKARDSIRRLIPLRAGAIWLGHGEAVTGEDVAEQLERAAGGASSDAPVKG